MKSKTITAAKQAMALIQEAIDLLENVKGDNEQIDETAEALGFAIADLEYELNSWFMAKRKYTRIGEDPVAYECCNRKCKWQGTADEKGTNYQGDGYSESICPKCCGNEFYGLLDAPVQADA